MATDVPNWVFSLFAFVGFVIILIPLPWHLHAWNTGTCMFIIWTAVMLLVLFINSVVWNSDAINRAPIWCDISGQIIIASSIAIPASCLCISRRLYHITSIQSVTTSPSQKRREVIVDLAIGLGAPILVLALHPIVQPRRFLILEKFGCFPPTLNSPPAYAIFNIWPIIIGLVSASYSIRTLRQLSIRRAQFNELLSANKNLSSSRYFRLMGLCFVDIAFTIPIGCIFIYINLTSGSLQAWKSWDSSHADFYDIIQVPASMWQTDSMSIAGPEVARWMAVLCAFVFFGFFGFAAEAKRNYRLAYASIGRRVGLSTGTWTGTGHVIPSLDGWVVTDGSVISNSTNPDMPCDSRTTTMPVHIAQNTKKRDSFGSFVSRVSLPDVGGTLADTKREEHISPSTTLSVAKFEDSFLRMPVNLDNVNLPTLPETTLDMSTPPRYTRSTM